ncbi:flagellar FliJ protein [Methylobacterium sp. PvP062]|jgi:flagellar FliJ protein|uniref:Flagellar FliJ protein n=6 Tax=Methylobacterium TaxID=407 RepID=A0AAE8HS89_9HYPH|nr:MULTISPECIES: flagellar export protein FliJ [Methylobacterium]KOX58894.1 flagellar export protein FliJ [Streptomyces purpurogeneiscleroticus]MCX7331968.1 flagellar export protein FliJ [Hyphomicrobiales bacterium]GAN49266.1 flagellar export protein FliJ [Methylobacterium sp. ME121]ACB27520.1 flagellar export protein FliJ [Methylobacterium radiotolerans JCM 2831]AIQ93912.1 flagellar export protein FliJ [Methylobacterium oryzae CBMB20]
MKSRDTLIRLRRFQVDEKRRRVTQIEMMMADFQRMAVELDREVAVEEARAGITDVGHFAYPTYARAAATRRDNMIQSAQALEGQLAEAKAELGEAFEELKKVEILNDRERTAERAAESARDQAAMDGIGLNRARG